MSTSSTFVASSITPSSWIFTIWILIYIYQLAWIVFSIILAFNKKSCIVPIGSYVGFMFASVFNFIWLVTYNFNQIVTSFIVIFLLLASIGFSAYWGAIYIGRCREDELCSRTRFILHIVFVNGLFLYFTWILFALHLNLDNLFVYSGVLVNTSGAIILGILAFFQISIFVTDVFLWRGAMRNTLVVYPVFALGLIAIITYTGSSFFASAGEISGLVIFNLLLSMILFGIKLFIAIRHRNCHRSVSHCRNKA
ncbi:hypothetical protein HZS_1842 [Henneguya salminicola]|nr:hypothetical protein HZS_1842 [Henneguya salminicola]